MPGCRLAARLRFGCIGYAEAIEVTIFACLSQPGKQLSGGLTLAGQYTREMPVIDTDAFGELA